MVFIEILLILTWQISIQEELPSRPKVSSTLPVETPRKSTKLEAKPAGPPDVDVRVCLDPKAAHSPETRSINFTK